MYVPQGGRDLSTSTVPGGFILELGWMVMSHEANRMGKGRGKRRERRTELAIALCSGLVLPALGHIILTKAFFPKV